MPLRSSQALAPCLPCVAGPAGHLQPGAAPGPDGLHGAEAEGAAGQPGAGGERAARARRPALPQASCVGGMLRPRWQPLQAVTTWGSVTRLVWRQGPSQAAPSSLHACRPATCPTGAAVTLRRGNSTTACQREGAGGVLCCARRLQKVSMPAAPAPAQVRMNESGMPPLVLAVAPPATARAMQQESDDIRVGCLIL